MKEIETVRRYGKTKGNTERKSDTLMLFTCESENKHTRSRSRTWEHERPRSSNLLCLSLYFIVMITSGGQKLKRGIKLWPVGVRLGL